MVKFWNHPKMGNINEGDMITLLSDSKKPLKSSLYNGKLSVNANAETNIVIEGATGSAQPATVNAAVNATVIKSNSNQSEDQLDCIQLADKMAEFSYHLHSAIETKCAALPEKVRHAIVANGLEAAASWWFGAKSTKSPMVEEEPKENQLTENNEFSDDFEEEAF